MAGSEPKLKEVFQDVKDRRAISNALVKAKQCSEAFHAMEKTAERYHSMIHDLNKQYTGLFAGYVGVCKNLTGGTKNRVSNNVANLPRQHTLMDSIQNNARIVPLDEGHVNHKCHIWWTFLMTTNGHIPQPLFSVTAPQYIARGGNGEILVDATRVNMVKQILHNCYFQKKREESSANELRDILDAIVTVESDKKKMNGDHSVNEIIFQNDKIGCTVTIRKTNPVYDEIGHSRYNPQNFPGMHHLRRDQKVAEKVLPVCSDAGYFLTVAFSDKGRHGFAVEVHARQLEKPYAVENFKHVIVGENGKEMPCDREMNVVEIHTHHHHRHPRHKGNDNKDAEDNTIKSISLENNVLARVAELQYAALQKQYGNGRASKATPIFCQAQIVRNRDINDYAWSTVNVTWSIPVQKKTASNVNGQVDEKLKIHVKTVHSLTLSKIANKVNLNIPYPESKRLEDMIDKSKAKNDKITEKSNPAPKPLAVVHGHYMDKHPAVLHKNKKVTKPYVYDESSTHAMDHLDINASIEALENFEKQKFGEDTKKPLSFSSLDFGSILGAAERVFSSS
jgi:hypothetical protein